jgi:parallel beta-helix repeat protein
METKQEKVFLIMLSLALMQLCSLSSLAQDEPRIPISSAPYTINNPGSYYFTRNLQTTLPDQNAITVEVNDVTIDLMGFRLIGPGSGSGRGIYMSARSNVEICNRTVYNFGGEGIYEAETFTEASPDYGKGHRVIGVRAVHNGSGGIVLNGWYHLVKDCTVLLNGGLDGLFAGGAATVTGNTVSVNEGNGLETLCGSTISGNTVSENGQNGIVLGSGCTVFDNTAAFNADCAITVLEGCTVTNNTALANGFGIVGWGDSNLIKGNTLSYNSNTNIWIGGKSNAVEENLVTSSQQGIYFDKTGNFYANNRASGNVSDYVNTASQTDGGGNISF